MSSLPPLPVSKRLLTLVLSFAAPLALRAEFSTSGLHTITLPSANPATYAFAAPGFPFTLQPTGDLGSDPQPWLHNGKPVAGSDGSVPFTVTSATAEDAGFYAVRWPNGNYFPFPVSVFTPPRSTADPRFFIPAPPQAVFLIGEADDGSFLLGHQFGSTVESMARFLADGTPDPGFSLPAAVGKVLLVLPDGGMITSHPPYRLNRQGVAAPLNLPIPFVDGQPLAAAILQDDGKLLLGQHSLETYDVPSTSPPAVKHLNHWSLVRLTPSGDLDHTFNFGPSRLGSISTLDLALDGGILVKTYESYIDAHYDPSEGASYLRKFLSDGSVDLSFTPIHVGFPYSPSAMEARERPDGRLVVRSDESISLYEADGTPVAGVMSIQAGYLGSWFYAPDGSMFHRARGNGTHYSLSGSTVLRRRAEDFSIDASFHLGHVDGISVLGQFRNGDLLVWSTFLDDSGNEVSGLYRADPERGLNQELPVAPVLSLAFAALRAGGEFKLEAVPNLIDRPASYEWIGVDGHHISIDVNGSELHLTDLELDDLGIFGLLTRSAQGAVASSTSHLTLQNQPAVHFANLSARVAIGTGDATPVIGIVTDASSSSDAKRVLLRAVGPGLAPFGVQNFVADPNLALLRSNGTEVARNDDWSTASDPDALRAESAAVGAFSLEHSPKDAAMLAALDSSLPFTVHVGSADVPPSGIALMEVYDLSTPWIRSLTNLSVRAQIGRDENSLIGGLVIVDPTGFGRSKRVLIRAVGPGLAGFLDGSLSDPVLTLFDAEGNEIARNSGWGSQSNSAEIADVGDRIGAFALESGSADSVLLLDISPGAYTAQISSSTGQTGVALLEIYSAP